jgi:hypothetical protein
LDIPQFIAEMLVRSKFMSLSEQYQQQIVDTIKHLSEKELAELADFVKKYQPRPNENVVKLGGLLKGFEPTDEEIQQARKEMWQHLDRKEI